jgi:hypothetical protein
VVGTQFVNLDGKLESLDLPDPKNYKECSRKYNETECTMYAELVKGMEILWKENQPILITCCALAIFVGFFQLTISLVVCFSDPKVCVSVCLCNYQSSLITCSIYLVY